MNADLFRAFAVTVSLLVLLRHQRHPHGHAPLPRTRRQTAGIVTAEGSATALNLDPSAGKSQDAKQGLSTDRPCWHIHALLSGIAAKDA
jgi:hypothetical protein